MEILQGQLSDDVLGQLSNQIGADKEQTASAAQGIFATLLGGLANNASTESGLSALGTALDRDHDGSMLDDLMGMVGGMMQGGDAAPANSAVNGAGILGHILGDKQEVAAQQISQSSGLNVGQIMKLMPILAPIVMGVLGRAKSSGGLDLGSLAGILMGSAQNAQAGGLGDLIGSVLGGLLSGGNQSGVPGLGFTQNTGTSTPQQNTGNQNDGGMLGQILGDIFKK